MMRHLVLGVALILARPAWGEVIAADASGFEVRNAVTVAAPPARVWATLVEPARWWSPAHSWSGAAANLSLEPRAGGCFCERLPGSGGVEHLRVIHAAPGRLLRMAGALGPLQADAIAGVLTVELKPAGEDTTVTLTYAVAGRRTGGLVQLAPAVNGMLGEQLARLKSAAERR